MGQSTWRTRELEIEFIFPEREGVQGRERAFKGEFQEREFIFQRESEEVCPGYLTSAFRHHPNGCLDQLDPMLALGAALFLHPINKSTCHV